MIWEYQAHALRADSYKIVRTVKGLTVWHEPSSGPFARIGDLYPSLTAAKAAAKAHQESLCQPNPK